MNVTRTSRLTGVTRTRDLDITPEQVAAYQRGARVQHAFPHLSDDDREFWISGITPDEWDAAFPRGDDDDDE
jgi:hypothetical protein